MDRRSRAYLVLQNELHEATRQPDLLARGRTSMMAMEHIKNTGLRGIPVGATSISYIDGDRGVLLYRGFRIEDLAERSTFPETVFLLLSGRLPTGQELETMGSDFIQALDMPLFLLGTMERWPVQSHPMDVLQAAMPILSMADPEGKSPSLEAGFRAAVRIIVRIAAAAAAWHRIRHGFPLLQPREGLSHAGNFLWQLTGRNPGEELARPLEISMILQAEHTFNASTFACRQVAAAGGGMYEAVAAGLGALSGGWHGGANARVMEMILGMEAQGVMETDVSSWVRKRLNRGERIMGMGHPVYKTRDPRAEILRRLCEQMAGRTGHTQRYRMLLRVQQESEKEFMARGKPGIKANVDFWSGLLYSMLSIPLDLMTPLFATSLVAGWCAHIMEERAGGGQEPYLIPYEPLSEYIGPTCRPVRSEG